MCIQDNSDGSLVHTTTHKSKYLAETEINNHPRSPWVKVQTTCEQLPPMKLDTVYNTNDDRERRSMHEEVRLVLSADYNNNLSSRCK